MTLSDEEIGTLPNGSKWTFPQNTPNQFIKTKSVYNNPTEEDRLSTTFDSSPFTGPSRRKSDHLHDSTEAVSPRIGRKEVAFSLGDSRTMMSNKRFASSPLAGHTSNFSNITQTHQITSPPIHLGGGSGGVGASLHANAFAYQSPNTSSQLNNSPTTMRRFSPLSSSSLLRSPNGSAASTTFISRRRFSENSFNGGLGTSLQGLQTPNFGSLIGSYEESLLSGRMSSLPSKPLVFDAELGVLGLGKCKTSLKCPPHVNFKFPAYFYNLEGAANNEGKASTMSPYVGTIDLENYYMDQLFEQSEEAKDEEDKSDLFSQTIRSPMNISMKSFPMHSTSSQPSEGIPFARRNGGAGNTKQTKKKPQFPGYRVPAKGQVQLVIKNPNLTAVKVFLVPYDLTDMPAGTKTFVRQKCHVAPPNTPTLESVSTFTQPINASPSNSSSKPSVSRETLRYAVHLQFCSVPGPIKISKAGFEGERRFERDANGDKISIKRKNNDRQQNREERGEPRIYLHKSIRVVFSARVPDKSEKLTNATETPKGAKGEGMYSTYIGPSEEWQRAKMMAKEREFASRVYGHSGRTGVEESNSSAVFTQPMMNSDPNGERWEENDLRMPDTTEDVEMQMEEDDSTKLGVHPTQSVGETSWTSTQSSWDVRSSSTNESNPSRNASRSRAISIPVNPFPNVKLTSNISSSPSSSSNHDQQLTEDRAMLENWHATLAARSSHQHLNRSNSPTKVRSRPTSPPPASDLSEIHSHRSTLRGSTPLRILQGFTDGHNGKILSSNSPSFSPISSSSIPIVGMQNMLSPKLSAASIETEHANGVMMSISELQIDEMRLGESLTMEGEQSSKLNTPTLRPSLMRRLSSQASQAALSTNSGRDSPSISHSNQSQQPITANSIFAWRQSINRNGVNNNNEEGKD